MVKSQKDIESLILDFGNITKHSRTSGRVKVEYTGDPRRGWWDHRLKKGEGRLNSLLTKETDLTTVGDSKSDL